MTASEQEGQISMFSYRTWQKIFKKKEGDVFLQKWKRNLKN